MNTFIIRYNKFQTNNQKLSAYSVKKILQSMTTFYSNPIKLDSLVFNNYKTMQSSTKIDSSISQPSQKTTHKKGSLSCLVSFQELKKQNLNISVQIKTTQSNNFMPQFLLKKLGLQKQTDTSCFKKLSDQSRLKTAVQQTKIFMQMKNFDKIREKAFIGRKSVQEKNLSISKDKVQKALKKKFNLDQVYEIKEKLQKMRTPIGVVQNQKNTSKVEFNLKIQKKQYRADLKFHIQNFQLKKSTSSFVKNLPKSPLNILDFQRLQSLGSGVYGEVSLYRQFQIYFRHLKTNFIVAQKKISKKSIDSFNDSVYLGRQIKIHSMAEHPNIVQMYSFFDDSQNVYLIMEVCNQGNLFSILQREGGSLPEVKVRKYIRNVSKALEFLHDQNIMHRDIKPENILVNNGIAKLCDFGWSINSSEMRETLCGTPLYSSPQIVKSQKYDKKVDIWCIGIMTYELIFGRTPFEIRSRQDLMKVVDCEVYFPLSMRISEQCKDFIEGCLKKDVTSRLEKNQKNKA